MINQINLVGNLGHDPEVRFAANGNKITNFSMSYKSSMKDTAGKYKEGWMKVVCYQDLAEAASTELKVGNRVMVTGKLDPNEWTNNEGQKIKQVRVVADMVSKVIRNPKPSTDNQQPAKPVQNNDTSFPPSATDFDTPPDIGAPF